MAQIDTQWAICKTNSFEVRYKFSTLKQGLYVDLDPLRIIFPKDVEPFSLSFNYSLVIGNARGSTDGELSWYLLIEYQAF